MDGRRRRRLPADRAGDRLPLSVGRSEGPRYAKRSPDVATARAHRCVSPSYLYPILGVSY